ncbi:MAG: hypothetical protein E7214_05865 [Clostridium sp.]|nr:hypothetical protein [Clostridium sp.]
MTSSRIKVRGVLIKTIQMTIKYEDFKIVTRRKRLNKYFESEEEIKQMDFFSLNKEIDVKTEESNKLANKDTVYILCYNFD